MAVVRSVSVVHLNARREIGLELRHQILNALHYVDRVRTGLALHVQDYRRRQIHPRGLIIVLHSVNNICHVGEEYRAPLRYATTTFR